jgi:hypothetical protein
MESEIKEKERLNQGKRVFTQQETSTNISKKELKIYKGG